MNFPLLLWSWMSPGRQAVAGKNETDILWSVIKMIAVEMMLHWNWKKKTLSYQWCKLAHTGNLLVWRVIWQGKNTSNTFVFLRGPDYLQRYLCLTPRITEPQESSKVGSRKLTAQYILGNLVIWVELRAHWKMGFFFPVGNVNDNETFSWKLSTENSKLLAKSKKKRKYFGWKLKYFNSEMLCCGASWQLQLGCLMLPFSHLSRCTNLILWWEEAMAWWESLATVYHGKCISDGQLDL